MLVISTTVAFFLVEIKSAAEENTIAKEATPTIEYPETPTPTPIMPIKELKNLKDNTADFYEAGERFGVDPLLLIAISIHESDGGTKIPPDSFNPFGRICDKGYECVIARDATTGVSIHWIKFESWKEAIFDEAEYLRVRYLDRGLKTPQQINQRYASDKNWYKKIEAIIEGLKI